MSLLPPFEGVCPSPELAEMLHAHNNTLLRIILSGDFAGVEALWAEFWPTIPHSLMSILVQEAGLTYLENCDRFVYSYVCEALMPDVLRFVPPARAKIIRNFAKQLEPWMAAAVRGLPETLVARKLSTVGAFAQKLRRYTGLNHLAQAARSVLANPQHTAQMAADYGRVDFTSVQEQVLWACPACDPALIARIEGRYRQLLGHAPLEQWAAWLQTVVRECLPAASQPAANEFLLRWSFVSSLIIRDLTLRSATSFGMFHLMRLLCDEYVYYLVDRTLSDGRCPQITHAAGTDEALDDPHDHSLSEQKRIKLET
eukprot:m.14626 g.14626  ORF g.14626 m.14626 type:complete len:313 (-) comp6474_c0_seq2:1026-1964(-)